MKKLNLTFLVSCFLVVILAAQDSKENADFKLAVSLFNDKLYDLAYEQFRTFISQYPTTQQGIEARFYLGLTQLKLKKFDEARTTFQTFALSYPDNPKAPDAWLNVAESYLATGKKLDAALAFERLKTFHPQSKQAPLALWRAAELYDSLNDLDNLRRILITLTQEYSTQETLPARLRLAEIQIHDGLAEQAIQACRSVQLATTDNTLKARALYILSKAMRTLGFLSDARQAFTEITTKYASTEIYTHALLELGYLYYSYGNIQAARSEWQKVLENKKTNPNVQQEAALALANSYLRMQNYTQALAFSERAALLPGNRKREAMLTAGFTAEMCSDTTKAAKWLGAALSDTGASVDPSVLSLAAYKTARFKKQYGEALRILQRYQRDFPSDPILPTLLLEGATLAIRELHEPHTAIAFCEWLIHSSQHQQYIDDALFALGTAQRAAGNYEAAISALITLQRQYPASEFCEEAARLQWFIENFEHQQKTTSIHKLAALVGDVIAQREQSELSFRLGEIYFYDLQDYYQAAEQFQATLSFTTLSDSLRQQARYLLARSYEYAALREGTETPKGKSLLAKAITQYDSLLQIYPNSIVAEQSAFTALTYRLKNTTNSEELRKLVTTYISQSPFAAGKDLALFSLAQSYETVQQHEDALATYKLLLEKFPESPLCAKALYELGKTFAEAGKKDSAMVYFERFLRGYPNEMHSAKAAVELARISAQQGQSKEAFSYLRMLNERYFYTSAATRQKELEGDIAFQLRQFQDAVKYYSLLVDSLRSNIALSIYAPQTIADYLYRIALSYDSSGVTKEASRVYADYLTYDQQSERAAQAYLALAKMAKESQDVERTTFYLTQSTTMRGSTQASRAFLEFETAQLLFNAGKYSDALTHYKESLQQQPSDSLREIIEAQIVCSTFRLDQLDEANRRAAEFQKKYPNNKEVAALFEFERGSYFLRKEKYPVARQYFDTIIKKYSKTSLVPEAMYWNARLYEFDGKLPQAVQVYDSLLTFYSKSLIIPKVRLSLGNAYYAMEQWEAAAQQYKTVYESEPPSSELVPLALSNLILAYKEMQMYDAALQLARKYIELFPTDSSIIDKQIDIGLLYQKLGYYQQAILHFQSLLVPGNNALEAELRYYIGECYFLKGDYQQAVLEFLKVPYLVSKVGKIDWVATSYYMAGQSYEKLEKPEQAIQMYTQIVERKETDSQFKTAARKEIERVKTIMGIK